MSRGVRLLGMGTSESPNADLVGHVIGPLECDVLPTPHGYRHGLQVRCRCGWAVKGPFSMAVAINRVAIFHLGDPDGTPHAMGFRPMVDLWLTLPHSDSKGTA